MWPIGEEQTLRRFEAAVFVDPIEHDQYRPRPHSQNFTRKGRRTTITRRQHLAQRGGDQCFDIVATRPRHALHPENGRAFRVGDQPLGPRGRHPRFSATFLRFDIGVGKCRLRPPCVQGGQGLAPFHRLIQDDAHAGLCRGLDRRAKTLNEHLGCGISKMPPCAKARCGVFPDANDDGLRGGRGSDVSYPIYKRGFLLGEKAGDLWPEGGAQAREFSALVVTRVEHQNIHTRDLFTNVEALAQLAMKSGDRNHIHIQPPFGGVGDFVEICHHLRGG